MTRPPLGPDGTSTGPWWALPWALEVAQALLEGPRALLGPALPWALEGPRALDEPFPWALKGPLPWALWGHLQI